MFVYKKIITGPEFRFAKSLSVVTTLRHLHAHRSVLDLRSF
jgi:hypothetical protein